MKINEKIEARRRELGLTDVEVAHKIGLGIDAYCDIEWYEDEITTVVKLHTIKLLCDVLNFDVLELLEIRCEYCDNISEYLEDYNLPRNILINKRRMALGLSTLELADRLDYQEEEIIDIEQSPDYIESWQVSELKGIALQLSIPLQVLLGVKCRRCGR